MNNLASPDNNNSTYQDKKTRVWCKLFQGKPVAFAPERWWLCVSSVDSWLCLYSQNSCRYCMASESHPVFLWLERKLETCFPRPTFSWFNRGTNSPDHACLWDVHRISDLCSRLRFLFFTAGFFFLDTTQNTTASLISQLLMNLPTMQETPVQFLG